MTRRPTSQPSPPQHAKPSAEQMRRGIERIRRRIADLEAFDPRSITKRWSPEVKAIENSIKEALTVAFGHDTVEYRRYQDAARLDNGGIVAHFGPVSASEEAREAQENLIEGKQASIILLKQAISGLEEEIADEKPIEPPLIAAQHLPTPDMSKVFVVHGHDEGARQAVARFIEQLGLEAIILHERPNKGRTIITKFREEASEVGFAVVLMTPDDVGGKPGFIASLLKPRARQNVVFELGFFIGALGPERVAALVKGDIERPSDFDGVVYISLDGGNWKTDLGRELQAAGYEIDWNKVMKG